MFDTKNEQRRVHVDSAPPKAGSTDAKLKRQFIAIAVIAGVLSAALILLAILSFFRGNGTAEVIDDGGIGTEEQDDGFFGLRNPGHLADLDPTTAEDLQDEFEARPPVTEADEDSFGRSIAGYLSRGDFAGLDGYLREQEATYRDHGRLEREVPHAPQRRPERHEPDCEEGRGPRPAFQDVQ